MSQFMRQRQGNEFSHWGNYDAVVIGGGIAGVTAAAQLSRTGAKVLVIEKTGTLGWEIVRARHFDLPLLNYVQASPGIGEFYAAVEQRKGLFGRFVDPNCAAIAFDDMMAHHGVDVWFHVWPVSALLENGEVRGIRIAAKSGYATVGCSLIIDASVAGKVARQYSTAAPYSRDRASVRLLYNETSLNSLHSATAVHSLALEVAVTAQPTYWQHEADVKVELRGIERQISRADITNHLDSLLELVSGCVPQLQPGFLSYVSDDIWQLPAFQLSTRQGTSTQHNIGQWAAGPSALIDAAALTPEEAVKGLVWAGLWANIPPKGWSDEETLMNLFVLGEAAAKAALLQPAALRK